MLTEIGILSEINSLGYSTVDSQKGKIEKIKKNGKEIVIKERAYISGLMKKSLAIKFIKNMNISTDKCAVYVPMFCDESKLDIPAALDIPLTITYKDGDVVVNTHMSPVIPYDYVIAEDQLGGALLGSSTVDIIWKIRKYFLSWKM